MNQTKMEIAVEVLEGMFTNSTRVAIKDAVAAAAERGVSRRTLTRACKEVGAVEIHNGPYGGFWERRPERVMLTPPGHPNHKEEK